MSLTIVHRLAHYARRISQPGGIRYFARRISEEVVGGIRYLSSRISEEVVGRIRYLSSRISEELVGGIRYLSSRISSTLRVLQLEQNPTPLLIPHRQLKKLVYKLVGGRNTPFDLATIGEAWRYAPSVPHGLLLVQMSDPSAWDGTHNFNVRIPRPSERCAAETLVIYAAIDFLFRWDRLEEDLDVFLADGRKQVIIVLIVPEFRSVDIATHSYLLSILVSSIPARKFTTKLEIYVAPEEACTPERPLLRRLRLVAADAWGLLRRAYLDVFAAEIDAPTNFSALVISVQPRRGSNR